MYQYDQPHAERSAALLSLDFDALERLLGTADMTAVLDPDVIHDVERELAGRTFWNELDERDVAGRVARYAKRMARSPLGHDDGGAASGRRTRGARA